MARLLDDIIGEIQKGFENRFCENPTAWKNLKYYDIENFSEYLADKVNDAVKNKVNRYEKKTTNNKEEDNIRDGFKIANNTKGVQFGQPENTFEKLIAYMLDEEHCFKMVRNQMFVPDGGHIDIYCENENECNLIELKQWENQGNSPLYSIIEILKNYYLLLKRNDDAINNCISIKNLRHINLIVLAPKKYYEDYGFNKQEYEHSWALLSKFMDKLSPKIKSQEKRNPQIKIKLAYLNYTDNDYKNLTQKIWENLTTKQKEDFAKNNEIIIDKLKPYLELLDNQYKTNLKFSTWKNQIILSTSSSDA